METPIMANEHVGPPNAAIQHYYYTGQVLIVDKSR